MIKSYLSFLGILLLALTTHGQFQTCNSSTTKSLKDIYFFDAITGIAVGDSGVIVRSVDGGLNWSTVMTNDTVSFTRVKFFDSSTGIAVGSDIFKTMDAGLTWSRIPFDNYDFYDVEILNSTTCIISGSPTALIKSTDLCVTFDTLVVQSQGQDEFGLLSFVNENIGYACPIWGGLSTRSLKTVDGGVNWSVVQDSVSSTNPTVMEALKFISEDIGFKGGWYNAHLQKSISGGYDWNSATFTDSLAYLQLLDFHIEPDQPNAYYSSGWYGELFKSVDGGETWFELNSGLSNTTSLFGIYFIDDLIGWAVGLNGTIIKTTSGGVLVGVEESFSNSSVEIALGPNPTSGIVELKYDKSYEISSLQLSDVSGKILMNLNTSFDRIDISSLSNGVYLLEIETNKGLWRGRIVKD